MASSSLLDYARLHRVTIDHATMPLLASVRQPVLENENELLQTEAPSIIDHDQLLQNDKLQIKHGAVCLFENCTRPPRKPDWSEITHDDCSAKGLIIELPMLLSNHERDMRWFRKRADLCQLLRQHELATEYLNDVQENSSEECEYCGRLSASLQRKISEERLTASAATIKFLADCVSDSWSKSSTEAAMLQDLAHEMHRSGEYLTPLLSPQRNLQESTNNLPPVPSLHLELLSELELEADDLLGLVEDQSNIQDGVRTSDIENGSPRKVRAKLGDASTVPPILSTDIIARALNEEPILKSAGLDLEELQMEVPMTLSPPENAQKLRSGGCVAFNGVCEEPITLFPFATSDTNNTGPEGKSPDGSLLEQLNSHRDFIAQEMKEDKPDLNDKELRVAVPLLSRMSATVSEGQRSVIELLSDLLGTVRAQSLPEHDEAETKMHWIPIPPALLQVDLKEDVNEHHRCQYLIEKPKTIIRSEQLLYKGLIPLILAFEAEEEEEMIEHAETGDDIPALAQPSVVGVKSDVASGSIQLRHNLSASKRAFSGISRLKIGACTNGNPCPGTQEIPEPRACSKRLKVAHSVLASQSFDNFSATSSLASYLNLRGGRFKRPRTLTLGADRIGERLNSGVNNPGDPILTLLPAPEASPSNDGILRRSGSMSHPHENIEVQVPSTPKAEFLPGLKMAAPEVKALPGLRTIIIDSALINDRQLLAFLDKHGGSNLMIIYRDLHGAPSIILNPTACLVYANMQALTQQSLPGQKPRPNALQGRLQILALRYETVFVLFSLPLSSKCQAITHMSAMRDFTAFCSSFQSISNSRIFPTWVALDNGGQEKHSNDIPLFLWTWSMIYLHGFDSQTRNTDSPLSQHPTPLIQDETLWELFLCQAGMNAMAAQVVLGMLRKPDQSQEDGYNSRRSDSGRTWGLGKFVSMGAEQRAKVFGRVVGFTLVDRINRILDSS